MASIRSVSIIILLSCLSMACQHSGLPLKSGASTTGPAQATFPAQQRAVGDPQVIARGQTLYGINCRSCHGQDLRGGDMGGPNLLRSDIVLKDQAGELIGSVIREGRSNPGATPMPPLPLPDSDVIAIAEYLHAVLATAQGQGAPPPGPEVALNILVGDVAKGAQYFQQQCSDCHSGSGDLSGIASKINSAENLQNSWVAGRRWGAPDPDADPTRRDVKVVVTLDSGEKIAGVLKRMDDFVVSLTTNDGQHRSFARIGGTPKISAIDIDDPLQRHRELLAELTDADMHNVTAYLATLK